MSVREKLDPDRCVSLQMSALQAVLRNPGSLAMCLNDRGADVWALATDKFWEEVPEELSLFKLVCRTLSGDDIAVIYDDQAQLMYVVDA